MKRKRSPSSPIHFFAISYSPLPRNEHRHGFGHVPLTLQTSPLLQAFWGAGQQRSSLPPHGASQPFAAFLSSSRCPCWQVTYVHVVPVHAMPFANTIVCGEHVTPHDPQFMALRMFVSQPELSNGGPQWPYPSAHLKVHSPLAHDGVLLTVLHAFPHCPQFSTSAVSERQKPLQHVPPAPHGVPSPLQPSAH